MKIKILRTALGLIVSFAVFIVIYANHINDNAKGLLLEENGIMRFQNAVICSLVVNKKDGILDFADEEYDGLHIRKIKDIAIEYKKENPKNNIKLRISDTLKISTWNVMVRSIYSSQIKELEISCHNNLSSMVYFDSIDTLESFSKKYHKKALRISVWNDSMKIDTGIIGDEQACLCEQPGGYKDNSTIGSSRTRTYRYNDMLLRNEIIKNTLRENVEIPFVMAKFNGEVTCNNVISTLNLIQSNLKALKGNPVVYFNDIDWRTTKNHL